MGVYEDFNTSAVDYRIIKSIAHLSKVDGDPRYWRIVETELGLVEALRLPLQVSNEDLREIQDIYGIRIATRHELCCAFRSSPGHQYKYPWGDQLSARTAPYLMRSNPRGMGMNMAGLYFNGPDNIDDPDKNGLWIVTAEQDNSGQYTSGDRSGAAGNVGIFEAYTSGLKPENRGILPESRGQLRAILPENRGTLPEDRAVLPESRGVLAENRGQLPKDALSTNFLTPAGIGEGQELNPNEGYFMVRPLSGEKVEIYETIKAVLGNKVNADRGIVGISIGSLGMFHPVIIMGVFGHCLMCPNPKTLTMPINGPVIANKTGVPVLEYPEFSDHRVVGRMAIQAPDTPQIQAPRIYMPG